MTGNLPLVSLVTPDTTIKVSSTLDKSVGKKHLIDNNPETCWTSQQGPQQYIQLRFPTPVIPKRISLTFQGGFVGTRCSVKFLPPVPDTDTDTEWHVLTTIYPENVNRRQSFDLDGEEEEVQSLILVFEESSDFFGRVTVYDLALEGALVEGTKSRQTALNE